MSKENPYDIVAIGGSAGSLSIIMHILEQLPTMFPIPIVIVVHRLKNVQSEMAELFSLTHTIIEPEDKEPIKPNNIYLAPQNYHLLVETDKSFSLDYSETVHFSRPSIDVTFTSIAQVYGPKAAALLLSGANTDGADGLDFLMRRGGLGMIQDPQTAEYPVMPTAARKKNAAAEVLTPENIVNRIFSLIKSEN